MNPASPPGRPAGARRLQLLRHEGCTSLPLPFHGRQSGGGFAPLGSCGNGGVDLTNLPVEICHPACCHLDRGAKGTVVGLDGGLFGTPLPDMGGDQLGVYPAALMTASPKTRTTRMVPWTCCCPAYCATLALQGRPG